MPAPQAKELREQRAKLVVQARAYYEEHNKKPEDWTAEREAVYGKMLDDASALKTRAEHIERLETAEQELAQPTRPHARGEVETGQPPASPAARTVACRQGFGPHRKYVPQPCGARGTAAYGAAFATALAEGSEGMDPKQYAALQSDSDPAGGYLVASEEFAAGLLKAMDDELFIRQFSTVHTVRQSKSLGIRCRTAKLSSFAWSSELQEPTPDTALKFGKKTLTPWHLTGECLVSRDLLRVASISPEQIVMDELGRDAAEVQEDAFLTGNGANRPLGLFTASADGINTDRDYSTDNTTTAITADNLIGVKYSLKPQHRNQARWLFHREAVKRITKLKDSQGQYIWRMGLAAGEPDVLLGLPLHESERAPSTFTTGLYVGILGNFRYYEIADGLDIEIQRLDELYARSNQVDFIGRLKCDGMPTLSEAFARVTLA